MRVFVCAYIEILTTGLKKRWNFPKPRGMNRWRRRRRDAEEFLCLPLSLRLSFKVYIKDYKSFPFCFCFYYHSCSLTAQSHTHWETNSVFRQKRLFSCPSSSLSASTLHLSLFHFRSKNSQTPLFCAINMTNNINFLALFSKL